MEIREAIEGFKIDNALLSGRKGSEWQPVIDRNDLAIKALEMLKKALDNGYTLCKVNEALEKMEDGKYNGSFPDNPFYAVNQCIEIIKEACK